MWTSPLRILAAGAVVLIAAVTFAQPQSATGRPPPVGSAIYTVRPDPRLCPSPLCGGYWVSLANHTRTRCADGQLHPRCYVARAVDEQGQPLASPIPAQALVRGAVGSGRDELGVLAVQRVFTPTGRASPVGRYFRLVDTGIRCVRAPCFSIGAWRLNRAYHTTVSGIDLGVAPLEARARIEAALGSTSGLLARGHVIRTSDSGRVFRGTGFFLASER